MLKNFIIFLTVNLLTICTAFFESPIAQYQAKSFDDVSAIKQAATVLNVPVPGNWDTYMGTPTSSGTHGQANVDASTIGTTMARWTIPEQFRNEAIKSVRLLVLAATEGTYSAQSFTFDVATSARLTTLLVVVTRMSSPVYPNFPVAVMYVTINTNASTKQLYSYWTEKTCHRCPKCAWLSRCCCHDEQRSAPRGHTQAELHIVIQKMTADQFAWFSQQNLSPSASKTLFTVFNNNHSDYQNVDLTEAMENYLSNNAIKAEILTSYNDSVITAIQTNLTSLKFSSQSLKLKKIQKQNLPAILMALAEDYGFDDIYSNPNYSQHFESPQFSYENLFTLETGTTSSRLSIRYIWILGQRIDNSSYTMHFLSVNLTSTALIETMLTNHTTRLNSSSAIQKNRRLNIVRISKLASSGEFFDKHLVTSDTIWQPQTTNTVLNMLRFLAATILIPQKFRMLSYFGSEIVLPDMYRNNAVVERSENVTSKIQALANSVLTVIGTVKEIIQTLKSSKSITIERLVRFGFTYFNQKSTVLKAIDIPSERVNEFVQAVIMDYNLPSKGSFMLGLTYSDDFAWEQVHYLYSPSMNGRYRSLTIFKNGDSIKNTASFFIVDIDSDWNLAPNLLIVTKTKSILGGLYSSTKQSIEELPHVLTVDEAVKLQQFFMLIAIGNMANTLGVNISIPQIN